MHVDVGGFSGSLHTPHLHDAGADEHDHEGDTDVSIVELSAGSVKLLPFLLAAGLLVLAIFAPHRQPSPVSVVLQPQGPRFRFRPPLRAPPRRFPQLSR